MPKCRESGLGRALPPKDMRDQKDARALRLRFETVSGRMTIPPKKRLIGRSHRRPNKLLTKRAGTQTVDIQSRSTIRCGNETVSPSLTCPPPHRRAASYYYRWRSERLTRGISRFHQPDPPSLRSAGFLLLKRTRRCSADDRQGPRQRTLAGLCRAAALGALHGRGPCGLGPAVRAAGGAARHAGVVSPFLDGIDLLRLSHPGVPDLAELNRILEPRTGWRTVAVPGLVPDDIFFAMLSERVFPVGNFIRRREQLDYLEQPDCFHDLFGHIPMLAHHDFAEMVEHVGQLGSAAIAAGEGDRVARIYWHSVEFGLARESGRAQDPRRGAGLELRRGAFQPGERRGRAAALLGRAGGAGRPTGTTRSSRAIWSRSRSTGRSPKCWR